MRLSVVIPTYNRRALLERALDATLRAVPQDAEVLVSDDGSTDDTAALVRALAARDGRVKLVSGANAGPARARNRGWREATGGIVAFTDDDCEPEVGWGEAILDAFGREGRWVGVEGKTRPAGRARVFYSHSIESSPGAYLTCNLAFRREALEQIGGFDEGFPFPAAEDIDLGYRMESLVGPIGWVPEARVRHAIIPVGVRYHVRRLRYDPSFYRLYARHPERFAPAAKIARVAFLAHGGRPEPWRVATYLMAFRALHAVQCLRRGEDTRERLVGFATQSLVSTLSFAMLPAGRRALERLARDGG